MDKIANDSRLYTDVQGLEQLHGAYKQDPEAVKNEVAHQFESLLVQMMMRSMRDANQAFNSDLLGSSDMGFYEDIFDKQLSLIISDKGLGFAQSIIQNIDSHAKKSVSALPQSEATTSPDKPLLNPKADVAQPHQSTQPQADNQLKHSQMVHSAVSNQAANKSPAKSSIFESKDDFVKSLWGYAKDAASVIGVNPALLLAQAALETDWGKRIIAGDSDKSSHNLFNIKAGANWKHETATVSTLEQKNDILVKESAHFRRYASFEDSFKDYINLVKNNTRYSSAVKNKGSDAAYLHELQAAGYASDKNYASKIMGIMNSKHFQSIINDIKS